MVLNVAVKLLALLFVFRFPDSNIALQTSYSDWSFIWFSFMLQANVGIVS
jgi:hypothetical protein